ncbi:MAG TPA: AraC family transcriptional regulator [Steroidobacteraceae bacterium]
MTLNSRGHRYIGDDIDAYDDGDLVLVGPGVPHSWCSVDAINRNEPHRALVVWFTHRWATDTIGLFPELEPIAGLLKSASCGVSFGNEARVAVRPLIERMPKSEPADRLVLLIQALIIISRDPRAYALANVPSFSQAPAAADPRLIRVLDHLHVHFADHVTIDQLAKLACVSKSAFHRLFQRHTRTTAMEYLVRLRIGRACALLVGSDLAVKRIATRVGYANISLFNRQFAVIKGETPSAFRLRHQSALRFGLSPKEKRPSRAARP